MPVDGRIADMLRRHGPDSVNATYLRAVVDRVEEALPRVGVAEFPRAND
jgi:hypothetical protein